MPAGHPISVKAMRGAFAQEQGSAAYSRAVFETYWAATPRYRQYDVLPRFVRGVWKQGLLPPSPAITRTCCENTDELIARRFRLTNDSSTTICISAMIDCWLNTDCARYSQPKAPRHSTNKRRHSCGDAPIPCRPCSSPPDTLRRVRRKPQLHQANQLVDIASQR
jgi:hypothetical protein